MIDHEKLKIANKMARACTHTGWVQIAVLITIHADKEEYIEYGLKCCQEEYAYQTIDELIDKLREFAVIHITEIESQIKYWTDLKIDAISNSKMCHLCGMQRVTDGVCWSPRCSMKIVASECPYDEQGCPICKPDECHHESQTPDHEDYLKCTKCGELYK